MKFYCSVFFALFFSVLFLSSCKSKKDRLFVKLSPDSSGIHFSNDIDDSDSSYSFINEFGYMGGGVGIGDFNNDGLKDIFFTGNQVSCRLYINKGKNEFDDVTEKANLLTDVWATGVSIVDINTDGYDDIYVCVFGKNLIHRAGNLLFINQQNLTFKEAALEYGLADTAYSSQAVFFDYDKDGDLDMYLANYLLANINTNSIYPRDKTGRSPANDKLYRNDTDSTGKNHPVFTDVTLQANIKEDGYGLGVVASDFNNDGWQDIYVANDFLSNDELWLNNRNGTFTNCISRSIQHQSYSSMGTDAADINNDGLFDIAVLDMLPEYNERKKTASFFMNYERYEAERAMGYEPEFMRNMLQLNNGNYSAGDTSIPFFSEIGQLAGIEATDWSWSVLLADLDNDGRKDMHVTNGIGRDFINADFLEFSNQTFNSNQSRADQRKAIRKKLADLKHVNLPNYLFINKPGYKFEDVSEQAGINELSMSNGAAYSDLDNDGDLDLVVNNINKKAFVFINTTNQVNRQSSNHFLSVRLRGNAANRKGFGAKIYIHNDPDVQIQEQNPVRGYFSSVDQQLLFGLGTRNHIDSLVVIWPDNKKQVIAMMSVDTTLTLLWENAREIYLSEPKRQATFLTDITGDYGISYRHHDNSFNDFALQRLLPQKYSQLGPFITTADVNKDGIMDFFIGNGFNFSGRIFNQYNNKSFQSRDLVDSIKMEEDMDCLLFDADKDGDADLLVTNGDIRYEDSSRYLKPRYYSNDGKGNFKLMPNAIPATVGTYGGCVSAGDFDSDGDEDLFIGGRVSKKYPHSPKSYILQNANGIFSDVTSKVCPELLLAGMVTTAAWTDFNNDKQQDLIISGEWMPIRFFKNNQGQLREVTPTTGLENTNGMWRKLIVADVDNDGDSDIVAGNYGLNNVYNVSPKEPMQLFASDLDGNGSIDPVLFYFIKDHSGHRRSFPAISRNLFSDQVPGIKKKFLLYEDYAHASFDDIFKGKEEHAILKLYCDELRSCIFENLGNGKFVKHALPVQAQFAPINAIICEDLDNDGIRDLLLAGNEYQVEVITGRYDASYGSFLKGTKEKTFRFIPPAKSGFMMRGDVKDMEILRMPNNDRLILAGVNNDSLRVFRVNVLPGTTAD